MTRKRQFRVAFFTSHPAQAGSGSERLMSDTARALIARGQDARVYVMNAHLDETPPFYEKQMPHFPLERFCEHLFRYITGINDLLFPSTLLLRFHPWIGVADIWHFHNLHGHFISLPLLTANSWTKPVVVSPVDQHLVSGHCPYPGECNRHLEGCGVCPKLDEPWPGLYRDTTALAWKLKRHFLRFSRHHLFFHTRWLADQYKEATDNAAGPVLRYGVDTHCFRPLPRKACEDDLGLHPSRRFVIGLFHSYVTDPRKGILPLLDRLKQLSDQHPERFELLVVGNNSETLQTMDLPGLPIRTLPFMKQPYELATALNLCDVLLYPTLAENLSLTCLYAMACGVPVISFDVGGQGEAICHEKTGFLVPLNDWGGMLQRLLYLSENTAFHKEMGQATRVFIEKNYDFEKYVDELILYYKKLLPRFD